MTDPITFRTSTSCAYNGFGSYSPEYPGGAEFTIAKEDAEFILKLAKTVKDLDCYKIVKFDYRTGWLQFDPEELDENDTAAVEAESDIRMEAGCLEVTDKYFWFSAYVKHTNDKVSSEQIMLSELVKHFGLEG